MPGPLAHTVVPATCPHLTGQVATKTTNIRVFVSGMPVLTATDLLPLGGLPITGCLFQVPAPPGTKPQPCVAAQLAPAGRVFINLTQPALLSTPANVCKSIEQIPQGAPIMVVQPRVIGT